MNRFLAADRVYLFRTSPHGTVGFYLNLGEDRRDYPDLRSDHSFHHFLVSGNETGCVVSVALSLGLLPVAVSNCLCPMLPGLSSRANARATDHQPAPLDYTLFSSSRTRLSSASANLFSALRTCMNLMDLKFGIIS